MVAQAEHPPRPLSAAAARRRPLARAVWLTVLGLCNAFAAGTPATAQPEDVASGTVRFGFSSAMFQGVNTNDAQAAMKVWSSVIAADRRIPISPVTVILDGIPAILHAFRQRRIEAITVTTFEYWTMRQEIPLGAIVLGATHGETTENYLILVKADGPYHQLADLQGRSINSFRSPRTVLSSLWLETELLEQDLGRSADFFGHITEDTKLSRIVLPVFFGQADACLVTRNGFAVMCELNPQLRKQLRVLAESPALVPAVFVFRSDWVSPYHDLLLEVIGDVDLSPAGQQTLALFQQDDLLVRPLSDLDPTCELIDRHAHLLAAIEPATPEPAPTAAPSASDNPAP